MPSAPPVAAGDLLLYLVLGPERGARVWAKAAQSAPLPAGAVAPGPESDAASPPGVGAWLERNPVPAVAGAAGLGLAGAGLYAWHRKREEEKAREAAAMAAWRANRVSGNDGAFGQEFINGEPYAATPAETEKAAGPLDWLQRQGQGALDAVNQNVVDPIARHAGNAFTGQVKTDLGLGEGGFQGFLDRNPWAAAGLVGAPIGAGIGLLGSVGGKKKKRDVLGNVLTGGLLGAGAGALGGAAWDVLGGGLGGGGTPPAGPPIRPADVNADLPPVDAVLNRSPVAGLTQTPAQIEAQNTVARPTLDAARDARISARMTGNEPAAAAVADAYKALAKDPQSPDTFAALLEKARTAAGSRPEGLAALTGFPAVAPHAALAEDAAGRLAAATARGSELGMTGMTPPPDAPTGWKAIAASPVSRTVAEGAIGSSVARGLLGGRPGGRPERTIETVTSRGPDRKVPPVTRTTEKMKTIIPAGTSSFRRVLAPLRPTNLAAGGLAALLQHGRQTGPTTPLEDLLRLGPGGLNPVGR